MKVLVTGGAGFVGSHIAERFATAGYETTVLDDLSTGYAENVPPGARLIQADVADEDAVRKAMEDVEQVFHLAASRAVLRSVTNPLETDRVNTHGTLTVLKTAVDAGVRRVIYASSSSIYGGAAQPPTPETAPALPRSPYAVSKLAGEHYCRVFAELFGLETASLRYFNVYGPRQRPDSAYAAVIPLFIDALSSGQPPLVHGDGQQTRAFTYIDDVVAANVAAAEAPAQFCRGQVYNVAGRESWSILDLLVKLGEILDVEPQPVHTEPRQGDVPRSGADISALVEAFHCEPQVSFDEGLRRTVRWFSDRQRVRA